MHVIAIRHDPATLTEEPFDFLKKFDMNGPVGALFDQLHYMLRTQYDAPFADEEKRRAIVENKVAPRFCDIVQTIIDEDLRSAVRKYPEVTDALHLLQAQTDRTSTINRRHFLTRGAAALGMVAAGAGSGYAVTRDGLQSAKEVTIFGASGLAVATGAAYGAYTGINAAIYHSLTKRLDAQIRGYFKEEGLTLSDSLQAGVSR